MGQHRRWPARALILLAPPLLIFLPWSLWLDRSPLSQADLFWPFALTSLLGLGTGLVACRPPLKRYVLLLPTLLLVWRVSYFPVLVFSGFVATLAEWGLSIFSPGLSLIYFAFLVSIWSFHGLIAGFAHLVARSPREDTPWYLSRRALLALAIPNLLVATSVSFISPAQDVSLLPDRPWSHTPPLPEVHQPSQNPYLPQLTREGASLSERVLAFNAGITYELIPTTRWGSSVQGTLERLFLDRPLGSSTDRVAEHYLAYLAAHKLLREESSRSQ